MRAIVIGGAGFLGSHIIDRLLKDGIETICLDKAGANTHYLDEIKVPVFHCDITDKESLIPHIRKGDIVIHIAAILGAANASWAVYEKINVQGTYNALDAAIEKEARSFLFMSTFGVYGPQGSLDNPLHENMEPDPYSFYDKSKNLGERYIAEKGRSGNVSCIIFRAPVIYGPRANPKSGMGILFRFLKRGIFAIFGDAKHKFPVCYVKNLANAFVYFAKRHDEGVHIYNMANQPVNSFEDFLSEIGLYYSFRILKFPARLGLALANSADSFSKRTGTKPVIPKDTVLGMISDGYHGTISKAIDAGYVQEYSTSQGVRETIAYLDSAIGR